MLDFCSELVLLSFLITSAGGPGSERQLQFHFFVTLHSRIEMPDHYHHHQKLYVHWQIVEKVEFGQSVEGLIDLI